VRTTDHNANTPSTPKTGLLATHRGLLRGKGIGAPSFTSVVVGIVCSLTGLFALGTATALAAAPEAPEAKPATNVGYTTATLNGVLNPKAAGEPGEYVFLFSATPNCTEGGASEVGVALGAEKEPVAPMNVAGLTPGTQYSFCLLERNGEGEALSVEPYPTFTTKPVAKPTVTIAAPTAVTSTTASFSGTVNPNAPGGEPQDPAFNTAWHFECTPACPGLTGGEVAADDTSHEVTADATGLLPNTTYMVVLVASNAGGQEATSPRSFTATAVKPTIEGEAVPALTATTATLNARVNPNGAKTTYQFEYGMTTAYGESAPAAPADIGAGRAGVIAVGNLTGLEANHEYHWRITATNTAGTTTSVDHTFNYLTSGEKLPDDRAYEMVTPPQKNGAVIGSGFINHLPIQISEEGGEGKLNLMAGSTQCFGGAEACIATRKVEGESYEFARTSSGWITHPLAPPATQFASNSSEDLNATTQSALFAVPNAAGGNDWLAREKEGVLKDIGPIAPGTIAGLSGGEQTATADLSHFVYETAHPSWPSLDPTDNTTGPGLYEYQGFGNAQPRLVGLAPGSSSELVSDCGTLLGGPLDATEYGSLSEDGETVYFGATPCKEAENAGNPTVPAFELYARQEHSRSELISTSSCEQTPGQGLQYQACKEAEAHPSDTIFQGAVSDGSRVFFNSIQQLTDSASEDGNESDSALNCLGRVSAGATGCNLYESECPGTCKASEGDVRKLVDVSAGDTSGEGPRVQGVMAISPEAATSHVYFVAQGTLTTIPNNQGQLPEKGQPNLYVYERDKAFPQGHLAFIARLSDQDNSQWELGLSTVNVTPDGRFLVFKSHRALTTDDTRSGEGPAQVYRYDAQTGVLTRVSIGEQGFNDDGNAGLSGGGQNGVESGDAQIAEAKYYTGRQIGPRRTDPTISADGSYVFFQSPVGLTPSALNDVQIEINPVTGFPQYAQNVYEYHEGHVYLISDGRDVSGTESFCPTGNTISSTCLLGTDASGHDAFFSTTDSLVPSDTDTQLDFYDARVCEPEHGNPCIEPPPPPSPPCLGETCHGTPAAVLPAQGGGTLAFNGQGNLTPPAVKPAVRTLTRAQKLTKALALCHKDKSKKKRVKCETVAQKKYGVVKKKVRAKKAGNERRASR
jgi:hypothetical protein